MLKFLIASQLFFLGTADCREVAYLYNANKHTEYFGEPINYDYNETASTVEGSVHSVPGCPKAIDGYPWVQHSQRLENFPQGFCTFNSLPGPCVDEDFSQPRCFLAGFQGLCGSGMKLLYQRNSVHGVCDCDCTNYTLYKENGFCLDPHSRRNVVLISHLDACFPLFEQGPCLVGEWLILHPDTLNPICESRRCPPLPSGEVGFSFFDYESGLCLRTEQFMEVFKEPLQWTGYRLEAVEPHWIPQVKTVTFNIGNGGATILPKPGHQVHPTTQYPSTGTKKQGCPSGTIFSELLELCLPKFHYFK